MNYPNSEDCSIFFRNVPTAPQIALVYKIPVDGVKTILSLTDDLSRDHIERLGDDSISVEGLSAALAIRILEHGIAYTVAKLKKLHIAVNSKFHYKRKLPYYSLCCSDVKAKAEGRKQRL